MTLFDPKAAINEQLAKIEAAFNQLTDEEAQLPLKNALSSLASALSKHPHETDFFNGIQAILVCIRNHPDPMVVIHALGVLGRIKYPEDLEDAFLNLAFPVTMDAFLATDLAVYETEDRKTFLDSDESLRLRSTAAQTLGKLGDDRAIIPMMSILNDKSMNYRLRLAAAENLGKIGDEQSVPHLLDIVTDEREKSIYLKESAVKALGMLGDIRALEPLIDVLESKRGIRDKFNFLKEQIIEAIGRIGKPSNKATDSLLYALKDDAPSIRLAAVEALAEIGDGECLPVLKEMVFDVNDDVVIAAISAVYNLGGESMIRDLLNNDNLPSFARDEMESYIP